MELRPLTRRRTMRPCSHDPGALVPIHKQHTARLLNATVKRLELRAPGAETLPKRRQRYLIEVFGPKALTFPQPWRQMFTEQIVSR